MVSRLDQLIVMINQIAANNVFQDNHEEAADKVAIHIKRFWARPMKKDILAYAANDGEKLSDVAKMALQRLA